MQYRRANPGGLRPHETASRGGRIVVLADPAEIPLYLSPPRTRTPPNLRIRDEADFPPEAGVAPPLSRARPLRVNRLSTRFGRLGATGGSGSAVRTRAKRLWTGPESESRWSAVLRVESSAWKSARWFFSPCTGPRFGATAALPGSFSASCRRVRHGPLQRRGMPPWSRGGQHGHRPAPASPNARALPSGRENNPP